MKILTQKPWQRRMTKRKKSSPILFTIWEGLSLGHLVTCSKWKSRCSPLCTSLALCYWCYYEKAMVDERNRWLRNDERRKKQWKGNHDIKGFKLNFDVHWSKEEVLQSQYESLSHFLEAKKEEIEESKKQWRRKNAH